MGRLGTPGAFSLVVDAHTPGMAKGSSQSSSAVTLSAGVVIFRRVDEDWRVLLLRAYNYWDCPKGLVEPGEDPLQTARREVREETGIDDLEFRWGEQFVETAPYSRNKIARYYVAATRADDVKLPVSAELGRPEHHEFRWLNFDEARRLAVPRVAAVLDWAGRQVTAADRS
jgi:bis(5'-nucleosidyl)-tetraphosphatase